MPISDADAVGMIDEAKEAKHLIVIIKRLADAHHHDAVDSLAAIARNGKDLPKKLGGTKITHAPADGRGAEATTHGASDLRGDAKSRSVLIAHQNALDKMPVDQAKKIFCRSVDRRDKLFYKAAKNVIPFRARRGLANLLGFCSLITC